MLETTTLPNSPSERLLSLILLNEKIKDAYLVTKKLEEGNTVIQLIHKGEDKRPEEYIYHSSLVTSL